MASGKQHKNNVLKFKILAGLFKAAPGAMTGKELAAKIDADVNSISASLARWHRLGYTYIRRLPKQARCGAYRYKITKSGIKAYLDYKNRMKHGLTLNRRHPIPWKMKAYIMPTRRGVLEMGLTMDDVAFSLESFEERLATA